MLRVYAAAYSLSSEHHAVVEVGQQEIVLRAHTRWVRFTRHEMTTSEGHSSAFAMQEDGRITIGDQTQEMDMAAEEVARTLLGVPPPSDGAVRL